MFHGLIFNWYGSEFNLENLLTLIYRFEFSSDVLLPLATTLYQSCINKYLRMFCNEQFANALQLGYQQTWPFQKKWLTLVSLSTQILLPAGKLHAGKLHDIFAEIQIYECTYAQSRMHSCAQWLVCGNKYHSYSDEMGKIVNDSEVHFLAGNFLSWDTIRCSDLTTVLNERIWTVLDSPRLCKSYFRRHQVTSCSFSVDSVGESIKDISTQND